MEMIQFKDLLFKRGAAVGFSDMEIYFQADRDTTVKVFKGEIDAYNISEKAGLSFRGVYDGRMGNSFTEKIDEDAIDLLLKQARENAEILVQGESEEIFAGSEHYVAMRDEAEGLRRATPDLLIETAKQLESVALATDPRIDLVNYCMVINSESELTIMNTKGLNCHTKSNIAIAYISAVAKEDGDVTSSVKSAFALKDLGEIEAEELAKGTAGEAVGKLGAQTIESGLYPVILRHDTAASLLKAFVTVFSGESARKGLTLLQNRVGEQVTGVNVTLVDDPHRIDAPGSTPFDSEGMATKRHDVIRDGQLVTFLHNLKTAKHFGVESTGNAHKSSYRGTVSVQPNNLYIEQGDQSLEALIAGTERGLLLVELQGIHAGTNAVSGDFSLFCIGHLIENGQVVRPVNQITVSGNFLELLNNVEAVGDDLYFNGFGRGACGSPSLKIKSLAIAGK
ncbi:TldD/PmbA family protein [Tumebacillus permanentifrigoris]|uniref:PmbA protein n=1 Tax=Tumebacillus permanentifrigoris TaxID=378543 RepID=A0A316DCY3_9BACL|nr:TldD/PmbA family protein [Tumebacillus permanentifrigoris]PWK14373.1 PmbA protein [Tumebacillus permanentifrigoris]